MALSPVPYLSMNTERYLWESVGENSSKYESLGFSEIIEAPGATLYLSQKYDPEPLTKLDAAKGDLSNARLVWDSLKYITPALARENRLWARLSHSEGLSYSRDRWWKGLSADKLEKASRLHAFARTRNQCRDDHSIARLWWSAYVAYRLLPNDFDKALAALLSKADTRAAIVERPWTGSRVPIGRSILQALQSDSWLSADQENLREVMKTLNVTGAGIAVEAVGSDGASSLVQKAIDAAKT